MKRVLALDIGEKRIGVAISDGLQMMAHPYRTIKWNGVEGLAADLKTIVATEEVDTVVVGVPYTLKGTRSKKTEEILEIVEALRALLPVIVREYDERLTTKMAERDLHALNKKPSKNRDKIDQIAAVYLLQGYLDKQKYEKKE